ncbi:MAG: alpha-mannosidase [Clostridiales bacterium]|nr:alpha-mannosidase [Clostridiales bacterium]
MVLAEERQQRIKIWLEEMRHHMFNKLCDVPVSGFMTMERLPLEEALTKEFTPVPPGTPWGAKWEYGWFQAEVILPKEAEGKRIFLRPDVGGEMLLWVNGKTAGSRDLKHDGITLTRCGREGERFHIVAESYAGHGPRLENGGPCPFGSIPVPEPPAHQVKVGVCDIGIWNEEAFQLYMDVFTLSKLYEGLDSKSLRAMKIREGLFRFTQIVDFELEPEAFHETLCKAREVLRPLLECRNGSTAPEYTIFGQSHLDLAWLWPWEETKRKCARTISTQLALSEEYEDYKFLLCEPPIMETIKELYPKLYGRLLKKVEEGAFIPEGGMYVEPDTNLVSGESLIRQCLYGRRWFREELNQETLMVWIPDCFGFSGQLPQIMKGCGIKYFATQKMARALKGCDVFPYNIFWWEGIDGSRVLTHFFKKNNARLDPLDMITRWEEDRVQQENIDTFLFPFGFGDGGGGPTREMLEVARRVEDLEGAPRTRMESPVQFFKRLEEAGNVNEVYQGELYLPWHRGTYTSQAKVKKANRKAEMSLREAELWSSLSFLVSEGKDRREELEILWKKLLFHQFHDILPGTSITRVNEDARKELNDVIKGAGEILKESQETLVRGRKESFSAFNSLSWEREELIELPYEEGKTYERNGEMLISQRMGDKVLIPVKVPSLSYIQIDVKENDGEVIEPDSCCSVSKKQDSYILENQYVTVVVNSRGEITSFVEKETEIEYVQGSLNKLCMYQDINIDYDAWEMSSFYKEQPIALLEPVEIRVVEEGPLMAALEVKRMLHHSPMTQRIQLSSHSRRLDFVTEVDWRETHKLLKAEFPVNIRTSEAIQEIQFGYVKRPTHQNRRYDADRFEVCNHRYTALSEPGRTAAVLNDCKYGISTSGNSMELTLLKAPVWPDMYADKEIHQFTYSFYAIGRDFTESRVIQEGMELNHKLSLFGLGAGDRQFLSLSSDSIVLETIKLSEDGTGHMIMRLYESKGRHENCTVTAHLKVQEAYETTMEEGLLEGQRVAVTEAYGKSEMLLDFAPFEIKTIRASL